VELPARFIWRAYRAVLGRGAVPPRSALDKLPLTWRLMRLLPQLAASPVRARGRFPGAGDDGTRRLQLAQRLADLFDQYQVYRADWLQAWEAGRRPAAACRWRNPRRCPPTSSGSPRCGAPAGRTDERRAPPRARSCTSACCRRCTAGRPARGLPRRVVLFGTTHVPQPTLQAITALARAARC
jgi:exodeoxyribonuclease V gamma subunit